MAAGSKYSNRFGLRDPALDTTFGVAWVISAAMTCRAVSEGRVENSTAAAPDT